MNDNLTKPRSQGKHLEDVKCRMVNKLTLRELTLHWSGAVNRLVPQNWTDVLSRRHISSKRDAAPYR